MIGPKDKRPHEPLGSSKPLRGCDLPFKVAVTDNSHMGTRVVETHYDDLDESTDDVRTVSLSIDGQSVEIDLSAKNFEKLSKAVAPYLEAGRKTSSGNATRRQRTSAAATTPAKTSNTQAIREWAQANGHDVNSRGRIKKDIVDAYEAAQRS